MAAAAAISTRERILQTALRLFNQRGLHLVGVREIARELSISPGNLQYHFKRKDDLVAALIEAMHADTTRAMGALRLEEVSFPALFELALERMRAHLRYRGVLLSYPELVARSPDLRKLERQLMPKRRARFDRTVQLMLRAQLIRADALNRADYLFEQTHYLGRSWLACATLTTADKQLPRAAAHHLRLSMQLWEPYATDVGKAQLEPLLHLPAHYS